jgi:predicted acetyltransferase
VSVELQPIGPHRRAVLENLFQLYVHDFSDFMAAQVELGEDGRFPPYPPLDHWFEGAQDRPASLIRVEGRIAGFVLVNRISHSGLPLDWNVAEFFVVRKYRRGGVGMAAAHRLWRDLPGRWEAAVARRNTPALGFWRRAIADFEGVAGIEELDIQNEHWNGPVLRFVSPVTQKTDALRAGAQAPNP